MGISPPIQVATIGMGDSLLLMVIALVVLGPRRLPQLGRQIGKLMYEFRKASNDFKYQMEEELRNAEAEDRRKREEAERQRILAETQSAVAKAQSAAEQALNAAAQAQSAAEAISQGASTADVSQAPKSEAPGVPTSGSGPGTEPDMIYTFGSSSEEAVTARPVEAATSEAAPVAESGLRVQPPLTGEQIPASRPGYYYAADEPAAESAAAEQEIPVKKEVAAEDSSAATESAAHHG
jgi:sec-independent protein translocase protein TatB